MMAVRLCLGTQNLPWNMLPAFTLDYHVHGIMRHPVHSAYRALIDSACVQFTYLDYV